METAAPTSTDGSSRLDQAGRVYEYLRANRKRGSFDPSKVALQFDVPVVLVERLIDALPVEAHQRKTLSGIVAPIRSGLAVTGRAFDQVSSRPVAFLIVTWVAFIVGEYAMLKFWPYRPARESTIEVFSKRAAPIALLALHGLLFARQRRSRLVLIGGAIALCGFVVFLFRTFPRSRFTEMQAEAISLTASIFLAAMYVGIGELVVLISGLSYAATERRRRGSLSRHELVHRYFELQSALQSAVATPSDRSSRLVAWMRTYPFACAALSGATWSTLMMIAGNSANVDPLRPPQNAPAGYLLVSTAMLFASLGTVAFLGAVVRQYRKVGWIVSGSLVGGFAGTLLFPRANGLKVWLSSFGLFATGVNLATYFLVATGAWFAVKLHRQWSLDRTGAALDEASILAELLQIRSRLAAVAVEVFVIAVDAAGSTKMKAGGDPLTVEYAFSSYQAWLGRQVSARSGRVEVVAGDGLIAAFGTAREAYDCALAIQADLARFNRESNRLTMPFRLRIAIHSGDVVADLNQIQFSHVIDVAAHVEKSAPINGIALTAAVVERLGGPGSDEFQPIGPVEGFEVFVSRSTTQ